MNTIPTREHIIDRLRDLVAGRRTREDVSAWATNFLCNDHPRISDMIAWDVLTSVGGADLRFDTDQYLYGNVDFNDWIEELLKN